METTGLKAAIYARFSTDMQADRSIDDQISLCTDFALKQGLTIAETYSDAAQSGGSIFGRHGLLRHLVDESNEPHRHPHHDEQTIKGD